MEPRGQVVLSLLVLLFVTYICEAALLRKSSAVDFLSSAREKRALRCQEGGCSAEESEAEELPEANSDYEQDNSKMFYNDGSQVDGNTRPGGGLQGEGSGM